MRKNYFLVMLLTLLTSPLLAKEFGLPPVELRQGQFIQGSLFSVKYVPGKKTASFFIVGKKTADLQMTDLKPRLYLSGSGEPVTLQYQGNGYIYQDALPENTLLEIRNNKGDTETFKIRHKP